MLRLLLVGAALIGSHHHQPRYWWVPIEGCTISTAQRYGGFRGTPYVQCGAETQVGGWRSTPEPINPADVVNPAVWNERPLEP